MARQAPLDYQPTVPHDGSSFTVAGASVSTDAETERVSNPDFKPSEFRRRRDAGRDRLPERPNVNNWIDSRIFHEGVEWRSNKEQAKLTESREKRVQLVYKQILDTHRQAMKRYNKAKRFLGRCTEDQLGKPDDKTKAAHRIVRAGPPITKQEALRKAREQVIRAG